jgi:hypothetical protein
MKRFLNAAIGVAVVAMMAGAPVLAQTYPNKLV